MFGFGKRKGPSFGLDVNSDSITLVQLEKTKAGIELARFAVQPTPPNAIREGLIADPIAVGQVVLELMNQAGIPQTGPAPILNLAVPAQASVIRLMPVPTGMPPEELADVVTQEAMNHVPFPIADANLDWSLMPATERTDADGVRRVDVILAAIQRSIVETYWRMCDCAGVKLGRIDISSLSVIRSLALAGYLGSSGHLSMIVNIRHDATDINVVRSAMPLFGRSIVLGVETLTEAISRNLSISFDQALEILPDIRLYHTDAKMTADILLGQAGQISRTVFGDITDELARSLEFYKSQVGDIKIDHILLTGPGCMVPQLDEFIHAKLNVKTIVADPMRDILLEKQPIAERLKPILAALIGTAIETQWSPSFTVDLDLNKEGRLPLLFEATSTQRVAFTQEETKWFRPALLAGAVLLVLVLAVSGYFAYIDLPSKQKQLQSVKTETDKTKKDLKTLTELKTTNRDLTAKKDVLDSIIRKNTHASKVLEAVRANTPEGIQLSSIIFDKGKVKLGGVARDFDDVSSFAVSLNKNPIVKNALVQDAGRRDKDSEVIDFDIEFTPAADDIAVANTPSASVR